MHLIQITSLFNLKNDSKEGISLVEKQYKSFFIVKYTKNIYNLSFYLKYYAYSKFFG